MVIEICLTMLWSVVRVDGNLILMSFEKLSVLESRISDMFRHPARYVQSASKRVEKKQVHSFYVSKSWDVVGIAKSKISLQKFMETGKH